MLDHLVREAQVLIPRALAGEPLSRAFRDRAGLVRLLYGQCGFAQSVIGYALQDLELPVKPLATQSLGFDLFWNGHAALTVPLPHRRRETLYLIDPTFSQFCGFPMLDGAPSPELWLREHPEGAAFLDELLGKGYAVLTPERAELYLFSLCNGQKAFGRKGDAYAFMADPPPHPYHYRYEIGDDRYSRANLQKAGLLIDTSRFAQPISTASSPPSPR